MNKRHLKSIWKKFKIVNPWYFSALALIFGVLAIAGLRSNNLKMVELREAVYKVDEQNGDLETALRKLREHVYAHMNTDLTAGDFAISPPIQLKHRYERLLNAERDRVAAVNSKVYADAQAECERRFPSGPTRVDRVPCVQQYVEQYGIKEQPIPDSLYKFDFVSPAWSPDLAGWSLVLSSFFLALFVIRLLIERWFKATLE